MLPKDIPCSPGPGNFPGNLLQRHTRSCTRSLTEIFTKGNLQNLSWYLFPMFLTLQHVLRSLAGILLFQNNFQETAECFANRLGMLGESLKKTNWILTTRPTASMLNLGSHAARKTFFGDQMRQMEHRMGDRNFANFGPRWPQHQPCRNFGDIEHRMLFKSNDASWQTKMRTRPMSNFEVHCGKTHEETSLDTN